MEGIVLAPSRTTRVRPVEESHGEPERGHDQE